MRNSWRRRTPLMFSILLLSLPAAVGVASYLIPIRGWFAGVSAAIGIELVYLSTGILIMTAQIRGYAYRVATTAVLASILFNTLFDYQKRIPDGLKNTDSFLNNFDILSAILSLVESLPLAGLAWAITILAHRLSETVEDSAAEETNSWEKVKQFWQKVWQRKKVVKQISAGTIQLPALNDVLLEAYKSKYQNPAVSIKQLLTPEKLHVLVTELTKRRTAGETKTATISALWNVSGGPQYTIVSRIYDEALA